MDDTRPVNECVVVDCAEPTLSDLDPAWQLTRSRNTSAASISSGTEGFEQVFTMEALFRRETDAIEKPSSSVALKGKTKLNSIIQVKRSTTTQLPTKEEARGGAAKCNLSHLPPVTSSLFTDTISPLTRI
ncbi:hypothetical protein H0H93_004911 [Arthromyces matolae]|nr:hypothetical protein H0H93_004911 [Arthromyces matolae]